MRLHGYGSPESDATVTLTKALLVYVGKTGSFATVHSIRQRQGRTRPEIEPGTPLTRAGLEEIAQVLLTDGTGPLVRELLPESLLYSDATRLLWWAPSAFRPIFFRTGRPDFDAALEGKSAYHPPLLFLAKGGLSVWALSENARPTLDSQLYQAPYFNIFSSGSMCQGNTQFPNVLRPEAMAGFEQAFFETNFTHTNTSGKPLTSFAGGHDALWKHLAETGNPFPLDALVPPDASKVMTIREVIHR